VAVSRNVGYVEGTQNNNIKGASKSTSYREIRSVQSAADSLRDELPHHIPSLLAALSILHNRVC
jgi:hypothetical protein